MAEITYRKSYDHKGAFDGLLLIQEGNVIHLSLDRGNSQGKSQWDVAREIIEKFANEVAEEASGGTKVA